MLTRLATRIVEKPWGRTDIPGAFGDFGGRQIGEIWFEHPAGDAAPLMVKFLFTSERLSIQVHPGDEFARAHGHARGKEECWLVLNAEPDSELGVGLREAASPEALRNAAIDGSIETLVDWRPAKAGDFVYNRSGTIHAIGAGLILVEVQQNVDCTYRLYDYGRPRELHLDDGLAVATMAPVADDRDRQVDPHETAKLVSGPYFHVLQIAAGGDDVALPPAGPEYYLVPLGTGCTVGGEPLALGEAALIDRPDQIGLHGTARALLCWAA